MTSPIHSFAKAATHYDAHAHDQHRLAQQLAIALCAQNFGSKHILEIGVGTGQYTRALIEHWCAPFAEHYTLNDLNPPPIELIVPATHRHLLIGDIRDCTLPHVDLITSNAALQWLGVDLLPELTRYANHSQTLAISLYCGNHYQELRTTADIGLPYHYPETILDHLNQYGKLLWHKIDHYTAYYDHPQSILTHCRNTGVNALSTSIGRIRHLIKNYPHTTHGYPLTHHSISIILHTR